MRLILIGCEYAGKTTLAGEIGKWKDRTLGPNTPKGMANFHDHFTFPNISHGELTEEEYDQLSALSPRLKSGLQNHQILYHLNPAFYGDNDNSMIGFHIEDAVYGPIYYDYGHDGVGSHIARSVETHILGMAPDTVLVLLKATPEVIAERMRKNPHARGVLKEKDIEHVLQRFEEEYAASLLRYRLQYDTTSATVEETLAEFVEDIQSHLTEADRTRLIARHILNKGK
jgi:shikimate kinase